MGPISISFRTLSDGFKYDTRNFTEYVLNAYGRNPHVYSVVTYIARKFAELPRGWFRDEEGQEQFARTPPNLREVERILRSPSWKYGHSEFMEGVALQLLIHGNAIIYGLRPEGFATVQELHVAPAQDVIITSDNGNISGKPITYNINDVGRIDAEDVLHIRFPNPIRESYWGLSPLHAGQAVYAAGNNTFEAAAAIHKNRGRTGAIFPKTGADGVGLLPAQQNQFQADWDERTAGASRFGGIHASPIELGYVSWGLSPYDLQLIEQNLENLRDVCRIYGISSRLFGDTAASTYNNVQEANKGFYNDVLAPLSAKIDKELGAWLREKLNVGPDRAYYCLDKSRIEVLNQPNTELSSKLISEVQAGLLTANEARRILYPELGDINQTQDE